MRAGTQVDGNPLGKEGRTMTRRGLALLRRLAAYGVAAALALSLAGDRGRAATVPAEVYGQDPLEVLELKVRPNVIVVLDSSGSMQWWLTNNNRDFESGDHPRSRLLQAKKAFRQVVTNNQDKVSFQFGTYTQYGVTMRNLQAGANRFHYLVSGADAPFMTAAATELTVQGAIGDTLGRGLQSWQIIYAEWNTLYFEEDSNTSGPVTGSCTAVLPGPFPKFYQTGAALAADLRDAMNAASCTGDKVNTYNVTYTASSGRFNISRPSGGRNWRINWGRTPNNIRNALASTSTGNSSWRTTGTEITTNPWTLLYRTTGTGTSGVGVRTQWTFTESIGGTNVNFYQLRAGRLWNGETIRVKPSGEICGMDFATAATKTSPPSVTIQAADSNCVPQTNATAFSFGGATFEGNNQSCRGFRSKADLVPCDLQSPPAPLQIAQIGPYIDNELPFDANGDPADWDGDGNPDYVERMDGGWAVASVNIAPSAKASGSTPIANSLIDIKGNAGDLDCILNPPPAPGSWDLNSGEGTPGTCPKRGFRKLWEDGQAGTTAMAGPAPWEIEPIRNGGVCPDGTYGDSATCPTYERRPKEKTIVLFVTDGQDTCPSRTGSESGSLFGAPSNERRAAFYAQSLYTPIDPLDPASSVQTYVIGYGPEIAGLDYIAWGGSGLGQNKPGQPAVNWKTDSVADILTARANCTTCVDAFHAPDAETLARQLQAIIDQGASEGDFNAQQSITESVFEYVDWAPNAAGDYAFDPDSPSTRYGAIVPTRFISSFSLPGFNGQLRAYQNDGSGNAIVRWNAGEKLTLQVSTGMSGCDTLTAGGAANECVLPQLHGGATDATIAASNARIKRRIYTTSRNGVYTFDPASLIDGTADSRVTLWPPASGLAPTDYTSTGSLDQAIGLPSDSPTDFPPGSPDPLCDALAPDLPKKAFNQCWLETLQRDFRACLGSNLPSACTSTNTTTKMRAARREARDIILAFMAGAATVPDPAGLKRTSAAIGGAPAQSLLFKARPWVLADSELATAAVVTPPSLSEPEATPWVSEYRLMRDGVRNASGKNPDNAGAQIRQGFGLARPDDDQTTGTGLPDARTNLKPVMTVIYAPANDMLHAFRAGPNCSSRTPPACAETGGEELWGFVPYDQLNALYLRPANEPQGRANHVFMLARGVRFADVFVPGTLTDVNVGGVTVPSMGGVWRRVLYIGRGIGGKYVTAIDVTSPGPYTTTALQTVGPIPLWSRGNPDTVDGRPSGADNGTSAEKAAYARMGETWSLPTVAFVNPDGANPVYRTTRRPEGVRFVIFMGSGYGTSGPMISEGTTHYTLDALSGDVIAAVDVETVAATHGLTRSGLDYANALVANSVSFNRSSFQSVSAKAFNVNPHPWSFVSTRVYVGDLHGRLWKFLTDRPDVAIPFADVGADQPLGTAVALLGEGDDPATMVPNVFVSSGNDRRAEGPFRNFAFRDDGDDTDTAITGSALDDGVTTFQPAVMLFARTFDQGEPEAECGYPTEAVFRGTIQPTSAVECDGPLVGSRCEGTLLQRVFFGGTRLSLPNTRFAPITPLSCSGGVYPCRSQFDSIIYALGVQTGQAAYDLNASGDDAYRIFTDSRIAAISFQADPDPGRGGSAFTADEGLMKGTPKPPPPPGVPPTATTATANVVFRREPGQPAPAIRYGSTVCQ
jgi:hypothetical protein